MGAQAHDTPWVVFTLKVWARVWIQRKVVGRLRFGEGLVMVRVRSLTLEIWGDAWGWD